MTKPIQIKFNKTYSKYFDAIYNCEISNRKSDTGLIEIERPMIRPRSGTTRVGNTLAPIWNIATAYTTGDIISHEGIIYKATTNHTGSTPPSANWTLYTQGTSKQFFYTDRTGARRHYRAFNNILYYLNAGVWTSLGSVGTNDIEFSLQRVPLNNNGADSTQYTTTVATTTAENVAKPVGDPGGTSNIGKILLITSGLYKGCYAPILNFTGSNYVLSGSGIINGIDTGINYKIYDRITDVLQIARGYADLGELYFDGITPMTWLSGFSTDSLIQVSAISTGKGLKKMISFNNTCWTFSGSTLFYTGSYPGNPLFFNYTGALTVSSNGSIVDIFQYKTRLVVLGTNFIFSISTAFQVDRHVTVFGAVRDGFINIGGDVYILTTGKTIISLKETIAGVVEIKDDFGQEIGNYVVNFNADICFGYDAYRVYLYGASSPGAPGTMCVLDTTYDFWIIYDNLRPSSIVSENGITYLSDNYTDIVREFNPNILTDVTLEGDSSFTQSLLVKEIDYNDIFSQKLIDYVQFSCENYTQKFGVDLYVALNNINAKKETEIIQLDEIAIGGGTLGEGNLGLNTFGQEGMLDIISVPRLKEITYSADSANLFKLYVVGLDGLYFYLSQIDIGIGFDGEPKTYFDTANSQ